MSNYLVGVLNSEGGLSTDISSQVKVIIKKTNELQSYMKSTINEERMSLEQLLQDIQRLTLGAHFLTEKMLTFREKIDSAIKSEFSSCIKELNELSNSFEEINTSLMFLVELSVIYSLINKAENKLMNKELFECAQLIKNYQKLMLKDRHEMKCIELYQSLSDGGNKLHEKCLQEINTLWATYIKWEVEVAKEAKYTKLHVHAECKAAITDILKASDLLQNTSLEHDFKNKFLNCLVMEILKHKVIVRESHHADKYIELEIGLIKQTPVSTDVLKNLKKIVDFLSAHLEMVIRGNFKFLDKIAISIGTQLMKHLINDYLVEVVPGSTAELGKYEELMIQAEDFEKHLKKLKFLPKNAKYILDHKNNINNLFVNKFSVSYMDRARIIVKKDLDKTVYSDDLVITQLNKLPENCLNILKNVFNIKEPTYVYSKTQISQPTQEIADLVKQIMLEAMRSKDAFAVSIFNTILNVFEIYIAIVPFHHKRPLDTVPVHGALFHNNCLYFAYYLINLVSEFYGRVPPILHDHFHKILESAGLIRSLAKEKLEKHVTYQRNDIMKIIRKSDLGNLEEDPESDTSSRGSVRLFMRQLHLLEVSWKKLLPPKEYHHALGFLIDTAIDEFISLIMTFEDIPCTMATNLVSAFNIVLERAPTLFLDPKEVFQHSERWLKLNEFVLVLKGGLRDIDDRWSDGKGPLAHEFTAEQVKHLVRALFQNSERRAELLSRIK